MIIHKKRIEMAKYINGKRWDARETNISFADAEDEATLMHKHGMEVKIKKLANGKYSVWIHNPAWAKPGWKPRKNISSKRK
jgi:hypothetical protein